MVAKTKDSCTVHVNTLNQVAISNSCNMYMQLLSLLIVLQEKQLLIFHDKDKNRSRVLTLIERRTNLTRHIRETCKMAR